MWLTLDSCINFRSCKSVILLYNNSINDDDNENNNGGNGNNNSNGNNSGNYSDNNYNYNYNYKSIYTSSSHLKATFWRCYSLPIFHHALFESPDLLYLMPSLTLALSQSLTF